MKTTRHKAQRKTTRRGAAAVPVDATAALSQGAVHLVPTKIPKIQGYEVVLFNSLGSADSGGAQMG